MRPAYMIASRSETVRSTGMSWVMNTTPDMIRWSSISRSMSISAFWLDTSSADVGSSAISSRGFSSVEITVTTRCFMPPDSWCG